MAPDHRPLDVILVFRMVTKRTARWPWTHPGGAAALEAKVILGHGDHLRLERSLLDPHAMEDDRQLVGQCDACLPEARPPADRCSPLLQGERQGCARLHRVGGLEQKFARQAVPTLRDPAIDIDVTRLIPAGREAKIGTNVLRASEATRILDRRDKADRRDRAYACRHHQLADLVLTSDARKLLCDLVTAFLDRAEQRQKGLEQCGQDRMVGKLSPNLPHEGPAFARSDQDPEGLGQSADFVDQRCAHSHELVAGDQEGAQPMGLDRPHGHGSIPSRTDQARQTQSVVPIGLVHLQLKGRSRMPGVKADDRQPTLMEGVPEPH